MQNFIIYCVYSAARYSSSAPDHFLHRSLSRRSDGISHLHAGLHADWRRRYLLQIPAISPELIQTHIIQRYPLIDTVKYKPPYDAVRIAERYA